MYTHEMAEWYSCRKAAVNGRLKDLASAIAQA
jgi:hypothetical protein